MGLQGGFEIGCGCKVPKITGELVPEGWDRERESSATKSLSIERFISGKNTLVLGAT